MDPPGVVTVMSQVPAKFGGATAVICVAELTTKSVEGALPKLTPVAPVKPVPVTVTRVPPAVLPELVLSEVSVAADTAE